MLFFLQKLEYFLIKKTYLTIINSLTEVFSPIFLSYHSKFKIIATKITFLILIICPSCFDKLEIVQTIKVCMIIYLIYAIINHIAPLTLSIDDNHGKNGFVFIESCMNLLVIIKIL